MIIFFILFLFFISFSDVVSEDDFDRYLRLGIEMAEVKNHEEAIEMYKSALSILPYSPRVHYELAVSHFELGRYQEAIKYADFIINLQDEGVIPALLVRNSAIDGLGRTIEAIENIEEYIESYGPYHFFYFQMGFLYYRINNRIRAAESLISSLYLKSDNPQAHFMLGSIMSEGKYHLQAVLSFYYCLFIDPYTERAKIAHDFLRREFNNSKLSVRNYGQFKLDFMLSPNIKYKDRGFRDAILAFKKRIDEDNMKFMSDFIEDTKILIAKLEEDLQSERKNNFWDKFYYPIFIKIGNSEHLETFCYIICQSIRPDAATWIDNNLDKVEKFYSWLNED